MRTLRYGVDATWAFAGANLPATDSVVDAYLTIKAEWAGPLDEAGPEPPRLQLLVTQTEQLAGQITDPQDGFGNWALYFNLTAAETAIDLAPEETATGQPRRLYYDVTLYTADGKTLRPWVGALRMLPDVFAQVES